MNLVSRLAALERIHRPDPGPITRIVIDDRRGGDPRTPRYTVPDVAEPLDRAGYEAWVAEQNQQAHEAGRPLHIYVRQWWDR